MRDLRPGDLARPRFRFNLFADTHKSALTGPLVAHLDPACDPQLCLVLAVATLPWNNVAYHVLVMAGDAYGWTYAVNLERVRGDGT